MLELHLEEMAGLAWCGPRTGDGQPMADLIAYLMAYLIGRPFGLHTKHVTMEGP